MVGHIVVTVMNKKFENYFIKALHNAKIEEIKETYRKKEGFSVRKNYKLDDIICDIFVNNQEKSVIFDITVLPISKDEKERIKKLQAKAKALVQESGNIQTTQPLSQQLKQLSKSSSHLKVTNMVQIFAKTGRFKWIFTSKKAQIIFSKNLHHVSHL